MVYLCAFGLLLILYSLSAYGKIEHVKVNDVIIYARSDRHSISNLHNFNNMNTLIFFPFLPFDFYRKLVLLAYI